MLAIHSLINRCIEMDLDPSEADKGDKENSEVRKTITGRLASKSFSMVWLYSEWECCWFAN